MVSAKKGKIISANGKTVANIDSYAPVFWDGTYHTKTVRRADCQMVSRTAKCEPCSSYRPTLRAIYYRWSNGCSKDRDSSSHTNERYMNTPEKKKKFLSMKTRMRTAEQQVVKLKEKVENLTSRCAVEIDAPLHSDLS